VTHPEGKVIVGSLPSSEDMQHQVRRETLGRVLALEAAARELDLSYSWVLMSNDCVAALAALRKGCSSSTFLQQCSMRFALFQRDARCHTLFLHGPGSQLVAEGVDGLSRNTAADVAIGGQTCVNFGLSLHRYTQVCSV
jgi:hypothetical protein